MVKKKKCITQKCCHTQPLWYLLLAKWLILAIEKHTVVNMFITDRSKYDNFIFLSELVRSIKIAIAK